MPSLQGKAPAARRTHGYCVYGLRLMSVWPIPGLVEAAGGTPDVQIVSAPSRQFEEGAARLRDAGPQSGRLRFTDLPDGSTYLHWPGLFRFLVSPDGATIAARKLGHASWEAFSTYLLGQVLSFALLHQGREPLHMTVLVVGGLGVGLLGDCGYGKSTLAAAFLARGHRLLTDDLLLVTYEGRGVVGHPGPQRIKLFPEQAVELLGPAAAGPAMNPHTPKAIIPLPSALSTPEAVPLTAVYVLQDPEEQERASAVQIAPLGHAAAVVALVANTFNHRVRARERLTRQFAEAARLAAAVPARSLLYPRGLDRLPEVVDAVQDDLCALDRVPRPVPGG